MQWKGDSCSMIYMRFPLRLSSPCREEAPRMKLVQQEAETKMRFIPESAHTEYIAKV